MEFTSAHSWLQPPIPELQNVHDGRSHNDDWKDQQQSNGSVSQQSSIDLGDYTLNDIQGEHAPLLVPPKRASLVVGGGVPYNLASYV